MLSLTTRTILSAQGHPENLSILSANLYCPHPRTSEAQGKHKVPNQAYEGSNVEAWAPGGPWALRQYLTSSSEQLGR